MALGWVGGRWQFLGIFDFGPPSQHTFTLPSPWSQSLRVWVMSGEGERCQGG